MIVQANPGFYYLGIIDDTEPRTVWAEPVIAWNINEDIASGDRFVTVDPITVGGLNAGSTNKFAILQPNDSVAAPMHQTFASIEEWLASMKWSEDEARDARHGIVTRAR